jgi:hypothetical protein
MNSPLIKEMNMTGRKPLLVLIAGYLMVLQLDCVVADDPKSEIDIRDENGKVLIAANQIHSYDWTTHTLTLAPKIRDELSAQLFKSRRLASGIPFSVAVNGKVIYSGIFTSMVVSRSFSTPVVLVDRVLPDSKLDKDQLRIQLGYPTAEFFKGKDPRGDKRIQDALKADGKLSKTSIKHTEWIATSLREMQTIKVGMTREDLLKVFKEEGGLSTRLERRYVYRDCPYIKVDVKFEAVGAPEDKRTTSLKDKITQISKPFLEWTISD